MDQPEDPHEEGLTNDEFRLLLHRWHDADDVDAGDAIIAYLGERIIYPKVKRLPSGRRAEAAQDMFVHAIRACRSCMTKVVDRPRNYVVRSVTHAFIDQIRKARRANKHEVAPVAFQGVINEEPPADPLYGPPDVSGKLLDKESDEIIRNLLADLRKPGTPHTQVKAADAIEVSYSLGCSVLEACRTLDFSPIETETVRRSIRRWRENPNSPFGPIIRFLQGTEGSDG